jgi:hypothetical protein
VFIEHVCVDFTKTTGIFLPLVSSHIYFGLILQSGKTTMKKSAENPSIDQQLPQINDFIGEKNFMRKSGKREFYLKINFLQSLLLLFVVIIVLPNKINSILSSMLLSILTLDDNNKKIRVKENDDDNKVFFLRVEKRKKVEGGFIVLKWRWWSIVNDGWSIKELCVISHTKCCIQCF